MARLAGLSKQIAEMALQLMREGSDPDIALSSAARLSDATPEQISFADDLVRRRGIAYENLGGYDRRKSFIMPDNKLMAARQLTGAYKYEPNMAPHNLQSLRRENMVLASAKDWTLPDGEKILRISRTPRVMGMGRRVAVDAAENRLRAELAMAAAEGNPEKMQLILQDLGFLPDAAYNLAIRTLGL